MIRLPKTFTIGQGPKSHSFEVDEAGWVRLRAAAHGHVEVIRGTETLTDVGENEDWTAAMDATGNNVRISDGESLYTGAGFDEALLLGQVDDVAWARAEVGDQRASGRLLELGCGPGFLLDKLRAAMPNWDMVGVDPSADSVQQARSRGLDVRLGTADDLEPGNKFDAFVVMGNFQLHEDPARTLRELAKRANPGAWLYLDSKNPETLIRLATRFLLRTPARHVRRLNGVAAHAYHGVRVAIPKNGMGQLLTECGWDLVQIKTEQPRLLRFRNMHSHAKGIGARIWEMTDRIDSRRDQRAWIQVAARVSA